jgi:WD40 repeat protein
MAVPIATALGRHAPAAPPAGQVAIDLHGDPLPLGALARMGTLRLYHLYGYQVAYSGDGKVLVSSSGGDIKIWDVVTGRELHNLQVTYGARHVALSSDGSRLAAKGPGEVVCIWDVASGKELHRVPAHDPINYPIKEVFGVAFSPDGKLLATVGLGGKFRIWDAGLGKEHSVLPPLDNHYCTLAFSHDGRTLITGERNQTRLWEIATGKERQRFPGLEFIALAPDGQVMAMRGNEGSTLHLVQLGSGNMLLKMSDFHGKFPYVESISFAPDGKTLASAIISLDDQAVQLWDAHIGKVIRTIQIQDSVHSVAFAPDGKTLAVGATSEGRIRLFDPATGSERMLQPSHQGTIRQVRFLSDGKTLATTSADNTFRLWQAVNGKLIHTLTLGKMPLAMSQDGSLVAASREGWNRPAIEETVELWDTTTGKVRYRLAGHKESVSGAAFSPDGTTLAVSVGLGDGVYLWDTLTGKLRSKWTEGKEAGEFRAQDLAFSPDGKILATGHHGCIVRLREVTSGRLIRELEKVPDVSKRWEWTTGCFSIAFAPDGKSVAAVAVPENLICVWDIASGRLTCSCKPPVPSPLNHEDSLHCLAYSPDGKTLISAGHDGMIRIWDSATGKEIRTLHGHRGYISALTFSKDGSRLASGSQDCTVLIWDQPLQKPVGPAPTEKPH